MATKPIPLPLGSDVSSFMYQEYFRLGATNVETIETNISGSIVVVPVENTVFRVSDVIYGGVGTATSSASFNTDGSITSSSSSEGTWVSGSWLNPITASVGASYWIRFTKLSGSNPTSGTIGTWLQVNADRVISLSSSTSATTTIKYEISTDSGGATIVSTGRFTLSALVSSLIEP